MPQTTCNTDSGRAVAGAQFFALKRLTRLDLYEQSLIIYIWLHCGAKHKRFRIHDADTMQFLKCSRSKFYSTLKSLQTRALVDVSTCTDGWRDYELCWGNLLDLLEPAEQQQYLSRIGSPPRGRRGVDPSVSRTADPPGGQRVHHVDSPSNKEESASVRAPGLQENTSPTSSANTAGHGSGASTRDPWEGVEGGLFRRGVREAKRAVAEARQSVDLAHVQAILDHWDLASGLYGKPVQLYLRVRRAHRELPPDAGWPDPQPAASVDRCRELLADARRRCSERGLVLSDEEFARRFVIEATGRKFSEAVAKQALFLEKLEALR